MKTESAIIAGVAIIALVLGAFAIYQTMTLTQQLDTANSKVTALQNSNNALQSTDNTLNLTLTSAINNITALQASYNSLQNNYTILNTQLNSITDFLVTLGYGGQHTNTSNQQGALSIDTGSITASGITVYVRNTGAKTETLTSAYVDNALIPSGSVSFTPSATIAANQVCTVVIAGNGWADGAAHTVKIVASDGTPVAYSVHS